MKRKPGGDDFVKSWMQKYNLYYVRSRELYVVIGTLIAVWTALVGVSLWRTQVNRDGLTTSLAVQQAELRYAEDRTRHLEGRPFGHRAEYGRTHVHWRGLPGSSGLNAPDAWEAAALGAVDGSQAVTDVQTQFGEKQLRWMVPVYDEPACLACHQPGERADGLRGAASVLVPLNAILAFSDPAWRPQIHFHLIAWLLGCGLLVIGTSAIRRAIGERDQISANLQSVLEANEAILEQVPFGIVIVDRTKVVRFVNRYAEELIGKSREQIMGQVCSGNFCPTAVDACPILDFHQNVDSAERKVLTAGGETIPVQKSVIPVRWHDEDVLLEAFIDIRPHKRLLAEQEALLNEEQRMTRLTVGRELRMVQLKEEVNELLESSGAEPRYRNLDELSETGSPEEITFDSADLNGSGVTP